MSIRRNSLGRFRSRSRRRKTRSTSSGGRVLRLSSPSQYRAVESLIRKGPMTIMLVYSPTCPHCHTYMPLWKEMCALKRRRANMVSMEASTYDQTPMSEKQPVSGVPTVLFVNKNGQITEAREPRNREVMATAVSHGVSEVDAANVATEVIANPLEALPAQPVRSDAITTSVQYGGNPWAAFLATAAQAAPAAVLAGAYAISRARRRTVRSSGLPAPEHSAKWRRLRARLTSRRRR